MPLQRIRKRMTPTSASLTWKHYLQLCKPRVVALIVFTAIVGMLLAVPGLAALQRERAA